MCEKKYAFRSIPNSTKSTSCNPNRSTWTVATPLVTIEYTGHN